MKAAQAFDQNHSLLHFFAWPLSSYTKANESGRALLGEHMAGTVQVAVDCCHTVVIPMSH